MVSQTWGSLLKGLGARERHLGLLPGHPFLLRPDGSADVDVLAFFASSSFKLLSEQTRLSYAKDLRLFLSFLESQSKSWRECTPTDLLDFEHWRRRDAGNPRPVSGAKFGRSWRRARSSSTGSSFAALSGAAPFSWATLRDPAAACREPRCVPVMLARHG